MKIESGKFQCRECKERFMFTYESWMNRNYYHNNIPQKHWIFYTKKTETIKSRKWECLCKDLFKLYPEKCKKGLNDPITTIIFLFGAFFYYLILGVLYITIFFWIDLIRFIISKKTRTNYIYTYFDNGRIIDKNIICDSAQNIYNIYKGIPENAMNMYGRNLFKCLHCNWRPNTFSDFISKPEAEETTNEENANTTVNINNTNNNLNLNLNENIIAVNFFVNGETIPLICNKNEKFSSLVKNFYRKYPQYKNKNCYFLASGSMVNLNKTILENRIIDGQTILVNFNYV